MVKYFCDSCGKQIEHNVVSSRIKVTHWMNGKQFMAEVILGMNGTWNHGHLCRNCALEIVANGQEESDG